MYGTIYQLKALRDIVVRLPNECKTWKIRPAPRYNEKYS